MIWRVMKKVHVLEVMKKIDIVLFAFSLFSEGDKRNGQGYKEGHPDLSNQEN